MARVRDCWHRHVTRCCLWRCLGRYENDPTDTTDVFVNIQTATACKYGVPIEALDRVIELVDSVVIAIVLACMILAAGLVISRRYAQTVVLFEDRPRLSLVAFACGVVLGGASATILMLVWKLTR